MPISQNDVTTLRKDTRNDHEVRIYNRQRSDEAIVFQDLDCLYCIALGLGIHYLAVILLHQSSIEPRISVTVEKQKRSGELLALHSHLVRNRIGTDSHHESRGPLSSTVR